ncbi:MULTISPECIES: hypothetical protein [unclassified Clostridioides]|uniref:hypothetical protein n=1 Tax=unclassified Clostridioides TaxID=2635829 RepID=UPI001D10413C|nr:hypothetical protein [Clostridioides sp. ES-S-0049-03]MCC0656187.1 hypothetical protein [Clostridioides sp. ES-S-0123-01]MCC0674516.1 hypothetical protein [Clostridioides sp. ES-S-0145-01]MCC0677451.1 hypothetical protein [Clostridioides sp. ES-W-0018-02]MCC0680951.1 hypothetical protein [Clostridioides sp. ES-S-0005-03]MCC0712869.1 hypothetical protein [Clostridioides sp. ES-W-0017-02]UDN47155.1 hypothetical protein JJJ25_16645 [Clostridioides sp. ES-S-0173-01]
MEKLAKELGVEIDICLSSIKDRKTQNEVCIELIDSSIYVLIIRPKDTTDMDAQLEAVKQIIAGTQSSTIYGRKGISINRYK